jgi:hypothetical protein
MLLVKKSVGYRQEPENATYHKANKNKSLILTEPHTEGGARPHLKGVLCLLRQLADVFGETHLSAIAAQAGTQNG